MLDQKIKIYVLENQKSKGQNQIRKENFTKMAIHITFVHESYRKIQVFGEFLKLFILTFLVCQRTLSTNVDS